MINSHDRFIKNDHYRVLARSMLSRYMLARFMLVRFIMLMIPSLLCHPCIRIYVEQSVQLFGVGERDIYEAYKGKSWLIHLYCTIQVPMYRSSYPNEFIVT